MKKFYETNLDRVETENNYFFISGSSKTPVWDQFYKLFHSSLTAGQNKLVCLSLEFIFGII
jgi:hypothetical protein